MAHIDSYVKHLDGLGESYNLLSASDMQNRTGISYYQKGLYTPGAVMIQPAAYIRQAARGLSDKVRIFEQSPVVEMSPGTPHRLRTPKARIRAKKVILAVNGHVQSFGYYPRQLLHVFTYASMTRALSGEELQRLGGEADWGVLPADPMGTTVRKTSDYMGSGHRLTVRNRFTLNQSMEISQKDIDSIVKVHDRAFTSRFPMLADVPLQHRWGGRLCLSWNSVPAFGELEPGIWSAACQNGLGTVKVPYPGCWRQNRRYWVIPNWSVNSVTMLSLNACLWNRFCRSGQTLIYAGKSGWRVRNSSPPAINNYKTCRAFTCTFHQIRNSISLTRKVGLMRACC